MLIHKGATEVIYITQQQHHLLVAHAQDKSQKEKCHCK